MLQHRFMKRKTTAGDRDRIATLDNSKVLNPVREEILLAAWIQVILSRIVFSSSIRMSVLRTIDLGVRIPGKCPSQLLFIDY